MILQGQDLTVHASTTTATASTGGTLDATERVCTVDEHNVPTERGHDRATMRQGRLWHRATYCLVRHEAPHLPHNPQDDIYVLVQRRSNLKDYYPNRFDPTPGGVVGFGESYTDNMVRELQEEMGIHCQMEDDSKEEQEATFSSSSTATLKKLFTFPYEDEYVRVWGEFYECTYRGTMHDLKLQPEEVVEVIRMNIKELQHQMKDSPDHFMPDSIHAFQLYIQHQGNLKVHRRFLKGSSDDLERFLVRPKLQAIFFDCDDCLYFDNWTTAQRLTNKIDEWCVNKHGLPSGHAYQLYKQYGTALRGLLAEGYLEDTPEAIAEYLEAVHDIGVEGLIQPDPRLRQVLSSMDPTIPRYVFTASVATHARKCLQALGIEDFFHPTIIDCNVCDLETKHSTHSFAKAMQVAGVRDPQACLLLDDSVTNIQAARQVGWRSILVGKIARDSGQPLSTEHAELEIDTIHEIESVLPEVFVGHDTTKEE